MSIHSFSLPEISLFSSAHCVELFFWQKLSKLHVNHKPELVFNMNSLKSLPNAIYSLLISSVLCSSLAFAQTGSAPSKLNDDKMMQAFSEQHQNLMPIVAVADMYYGCLLTKDQTPPTLNTLITATDKNQLAEQLSTCLGENSLASDAALNGGLVACFIDQTSHLPEQEREQSMQQVKEAIYSLPRAERQRSFTQCVNNQTLKYMSE